MCVAYVESTYILLYQDKECTVAEQRDADLYKLCTDPVRCTCNCGSLARLARTARDERDQALSLLREVMWGTEFLCVACNSPYGTHQPDCKLVAVLEAHDALPTM